MSLIALLFAFLIEQARPMPRNQPIQQLMHAWMRACQKLGDTNERSHAIGVWLFACVGPAVGVAVLAWFLSWALGGWASWVLTVVILYATLGFRHFSHYYTDIRDALDSGQADQARTLFDQWKQAWYCIQGSANLPAFSALLSESAFLRAVMRHSLIAAHRHVFGVFFWFALLSCVGLGPLGAVLYRSSDCAMRLWRAQAAERSLPETLSASDALVSVAQEFWGLIDWLPARATALGFAVVGRFEDVMDRWRYSRQQTQEEWASDSLIIAAAAGALDLDLTPQNEATAPAAPVANPPAAGQTPQVQHFPLLVGLVWRTVVLWLIFMALLTLANLMG